MSQLSAQTLSRAIKALGAPKGARRTLVCGAGPAFVKSLSADLEIKSPTVVGELGEAEGEGGFDLIVAPQRVEQGSMDEVRGRLLALTGRLAPKGRLVLYPPTLAAPVRLTKGEPIGRQYDSLLFPEAAASGDMGGYLAETVRLSASTWLLLLRAAGLEVVAQAGLGEQALPAELVRDHDVRLSVFDAGELTTGRMLLLLKAAA